MDDEELRGALRRYAEPVPPGPRAGAIVVGRVARRRRRRRMAGIAAVALVVAGTAGVAAGLAGEDIAVDPADRAPRTVQLGGDWREIAESPLSPRVRAITAWTGEELVVLGGMEDGCPPDANCVAMGRPLADGAAYDPDADRWRPIAPAPQTLHDGTAVWTGSEVVVPGLEVTLAYDPVSDRWRELDAAPGGFDRGVRTDADVAFSAYQQEAGGGPTDWLLDPGSDRWTPLPRDPFGESYDRSLAWDGTRLWLVSMSVDHHGPAYDGSPSRLAVLEPGPGGIAAGTWRVVDESSPDLVYEQDAWWAGGRIVVTPGPYGGGVGRLYDPESGTWTELPDPGPTSSDPPCPLPAAGIGASWISGGGPGLVSTEEDATAQVPPCGGRTHIAVAAWAGDTLVLWGGFDEDLRPLTSGLAWTPTGR
ncbi:MAG TPA: hypothetical protein VMF51_12910 [Nocardioides sp.]|uniref:hypothetical protein n=1 Tax=Nocardioides sp. TaxID=35761 RepID=UPI002B7F1AA2|nr:hypothetical protein [Nocardioides sp.]HTW16027.1 hypothetical protein [Nocardioides sp.]